MTPPPFLVPSVVWYGLAPVLGGVARPQLLPGLDTGWGGMLASEDDVARVLRALDPALLLLNLAGYQAPEVATGIPTDSSATAEADLASVDMGTMELARGTARVWTPVDGQAHVSLWVEPRFPATPGLPPSPTLDLSGLDGTLDPDSFDLQFAAGGTGWLRITWPAGQTDPSWLDQLADQTATLADGLIAELDLHNSAAARIDNGPVVCGLLGAYDWRTWTMPIPIEPDDQPLRPGVAQFGQRLGQIVDGGLTGFLAAETSSPAPTALDRWETGLDDDARNAAIDDVSTAADELGDVALDAGPDSDLRMQEFARSAYDAIAELPVTQLLFLWEALGVVDFLAFDTGTRGGIVIDDGAGGRAPLAGGWVYVHDDVSGAVSVFFTDANGQMRSSKGDVRDAPWDYTEPFTAEAGSNLWFAYSRGARPVPDRLVTDPGLEQWFTQVTIPADASTPITLPDTHIAVRTPKELELWPLPWLVSTAAEDPYLTDGLVQTRNALPEGGPAPPVAANSAAAPRLRGLVVQGTVDAAAESVVIELVAHDGTGINQLQSLQANAPQVTQVSATLGAPTGPTRSFDATIVLDPAALPKAFGDLQIVVVRNGAGGPRVEAVSELLTGVQIALVDDPEPAVRGPVPEAANEIVVVDFKDSPQTTQAAIEGQTRVRRMIPYKIDKIQGLFDPSKPADPTANPTIPKPRMPRWMAEAQLAGADLFALTDMMRRRAFRQPAPADGSPNPLQELALALGWKLDLKWDGPDGPSTDRPYSYEKAIAGAQSVQFVFDVNGDLVDRGGVPIQIGRDGEIPNALPEDPRPAFVEPDRRRPEVLVANSTRVWGRGGPARASCLVVEWQPILSDSGRGRTGREQIRGGNGILSLETLTVNGVGIDPGRVLDGANAVAAAGPPVARLPDFRVCGVNPSPADMDVLVPAIVGANYARLKAAGGSPGVMSLSLGCWQTTMKAIFDHESGVLGGPSQFDERKSHVSTKDFNAQFYGFEQYMPLFGPPHGYGVGQIDDDKYSSDDTVWSFVANIDAAVRLLFGDKAEPAYTTLTAHPMPGWPDQRFRAILQREAVRRYNGRTEFAWDAKAADWKIVPNPKWSDSTQAAPNPNLLYPDQVFAKTPSQAGSAVVYYTNAAGKANTADGANTQFSWPITFAAADYGEGTDQVP
jgi:hypothetical protein